MLKQLSLTLALIATLSSTGCTLAGAIAAAEDTADPTREGRPVLDILAGIALDAVMFGTIVYVTEGLGPPVGSFSAGQ